MTAIGLLFVGLAALAVTGAVIIACSLIALFRDPGPGQRAVSRPVSPVRAGITRAARRVTSLMRRAARPTRKPGRTWRPGGPVPLPCRPPLATAGVTFARTQPPPLRIAHEEYPTIVPGRSEDGRERTAARGDQHHAIAHPPHSAEPAAPARGTPLVPATGTPLPSPVTDALTAGRRILAELARPPVTPEPGTSYQQLRPFSDWLSDDTIARGMPAIPGGA